MSVLAKCPNFAVTPRCPPNLEYSAIYHCYRVSVYQCVPYLTLQGHAQAVGHANSNASLLTKPSLPTHLGQPNSPYSFFTGSEHAHRTS